MVAPPEAPGGLTHPETRRNEVNLTRTRAARILMVGATLGMTIGLASSGLTAAAADDLEPPTAEQATPTEPSIVEPVAPTTEPVIEANSADHRAARRRDGASDDRAASVTGD